MGGRWVVNVQLLSQTAAGAGEADVPSCISPLRVPAVSKGEDQLPRISNKDPFTYHSGAAGCYVSAFWGPWT